MAETAVAVVLAGGMVGASGGAGDGGSAWPAGALLQGHRKSADGLYAAFGAFAALVMASFGGSRRDKAVAQLNGL